MRPRPGQREERARHRLAGLESDAVPAQCPAGRDVPPVVCAFIEEQPRAAADRVDVDRIGREVVGERLLDVEQLTGQRWMIRRDRIKHLVHVGRLGDGAVEVGTKPRHAMREPDPAHAEEPGDVPVDVVATKFYFQAREAVTLDPVGEHERMAVVRLLPGKVGRLERIEATHEVPREQFGRGFGRKKIGRIPAGEQSAIGVVRRHPRVAEEVGQIATEILGRVARECVDAVHLAEGIVNGKVERAQADQGCESRNGLAALAGRDAGEVVEAVHLECVADLHGVARARPFADRLRASRGQPDHGIMPHRMRKARRPAPLHGQRRLAPADRPHSLRRLHLRSHAGARHLLDDLAAKPERYPQLHGEKKDGRPRDPHVGSPR